MTKIKESYIVKHSEPLEYMFVFTLLSNVFAKLGIKPCPWQNDNANGASSRKLNVRTNLRWVAKRTRKFTGKCTQVVKKGPRSNSVLEVNKCRAGWPNGEKLALTCV